MDVITNPCWDQSAGHACTGLASVENGLAPSRWQTNMWNNDVINPSWLTNHMSSKVWDEITYPFLNFNSAIVEV